MPSIKIHLPLQDMDMWGRLYRGLKHERRFSLPEDEQRFVNGILKFAEQHRSVRLKTGTRLFRARISPGTTPFEKVRLKPRQMGAPPKKVASNGRLNPEGIAFLYGAQEEKTAVSEVRPWMGAAVTVARLRLLQDLRIVDVCRDSTSEMPYESDAEHGADFTWRGLISYMFSVPYQPSDTVSYAPTQYLAEAFRTHGFGGIRYDSAMSPGGRNLVIFDPGQAKVTSTFLVVVGEVNYQYKRIPERKRS